MSDLPTIDGCTIVRARYAKNMLLVRPTPDGSGMKTRVDRLCDALKARWTNREKGFVMSVRKVERLAKLVAEGKDASLKFDSIYSAHYEVDS